MDKKELNKKIISNFKLTKTSYTQIHNYSSSSSPFRLLNTSNSTESKYSINKKKLIT